MYCGTSSGRSSSYDCTFGYPLLSAGGRLDRGGDGADVPYRPLLLRAARRVRDRYQYSPSCSFAASDIMLRSHTGSKTTSTSALFTPGRVSIFVFTSCARTGPMPQPGAVRVILTFTFVPPSPFGSISQR